jgi:hypothetical protein
MHDNANTRNTNKATISGAQSWGLSPEEWFAFEQDMAAEDDYERWIAEMEKAEAGDAAKLTADLKMINNPL